MMDPSALAGLCALLTAGRGSAHLPPGVSCPPSAVAEARPLAPETLAFLKDAVRAPSARQGIARVAFAEAGGQGDSGLAAVVYAILNRLADGRWGFSVDAVLDARGQFEPVMKAGGDWRSLPPVSAAAQARIDTILNLALDGRLPDLTHGARFFQNSTIVMQRARDGRVSARLVNFGGATPSAVIGAHSFYVDPGGHTGEVGQRAVPVSASTGRAIFVGGERAAVGPDTAPAAEASPPAGRVQRIAAGDPAQALFVGADGVVRADPR